MLSEAKDPRRVEIGRQAMRSRWGPPRVVRLDDFPPDERAAIAAAIEARRAAKRAAEAAGGAAKRAAEAAGLTITPEAA